MIYFSPVCSNMLLVISESTDSVIGSAYSAKFSTGYAQSSRIATVMTDTIFGPRGIILFQLSSRLAGSCCRGWQVLLCLVWSSLESAPAPARPFHFSWGVRASSWSGAWSWLTPATFLLSLQPPSSALCVGWPPTKSSHQGVWGGDEGLPDL